MDQEHDKHDDLFRQMADKLRNHTEPYRQGAWERFAAKSGVGRPPKRKAWPYWAAAAMLVAGVSVALLLNQPTDPQVHDYAATESPAPTDTTTPEPLSVAADGPTTAEVTQLSATELAGLHEPQQPNKHEPELPVEETLIVDVPVLTTRIREDNPDVVSQADMELEEGVDTTSVNQALASAVPLEVVEDPAVVVDKGSEAQTGLGNNSLVSLGKSQGSYGEAEGAAAHENDKRWDLSVVLSPSMTSEKFNLGAGLAVAYRISDKISISSGVSLSEMGVGQHPSGARGYDASVQYNSPQSGVNDSEGLNTDYAALGGSYLTSVTSSLLAMDIPLDIRYHVTERFYSSVGISMLAVLDEQRTVHYSTNTITQNLNGLQYNRHEFSQKAAQHPIADQRFGGFLNFSVGHRLPVSRRVSLSFEPYFKLPVGSLSQQDMNLTHGGLKIVTGF